MGTSEQIGCPMKIQSSADICLISLLFCLLGVVSSVVVASEPQGADHGDPIFSLISALDRYGMSAVAAFLMWSVWRYQERMSQALERHDAALMDIAEKSAAAMEKQASSMMMICREIADRPCLKDIEDRNVKHD